jgi:hypothetical protein
MKHLIPPIDIALQENVSTKEKLRWIQYIQCQVEVMKHSNVDCITDSLLKETEVDFSSLYIVFRTFSINILVIVPTEWKFYVHVFLIDLVTTETDVWKWRTVRNRYTL